MMKEGQFKMRAAAAMMSVAIAFGSSSLAAFAATGTVTGDQINVRSDASTTSSIVGTANNGDVLEVGDSKDDDSGNTWYQVTLDDGSTGYIRYDFIEVTEDEATTEAATEAVTEETPVETDTTATTQETGDYQVVQAPDDDGNMTYYLYNNAAGERMKISDIEALQSRVTEAETAAANAGNKYTILLVALAVLLVLAVVLCIVLFLRLRDAMTNGRRERDLTRERADQRRRSGNADDLSAVKRRQREDRRSGNGSSRSDAYASGTRRRPASGSAERSSRSGEDYSRVREGARPARTGNDQQRETGRRPVSEDGRAASSEVRQRPVRQSDDDVRTSRVRSDRPVRSERPAASDDGYSSRDSYSEQSAQRSVSQDTSAARATRQQVKNFADDDDFDYDFISLDDK